MDTINIAAEKNNLIRQLLDIDDVKVLEKVKQLLRSESQIHSVDVTSEPAAEYKPLTKKEILSGLNEAFEEAKLAREGKLQGRPLKDVLDEL